MRDGLKIEICVEGIDGLVAAQEAGADRAELCASLVEGGLTPSLGTVREALRVATCVGVACFGLAGASPQKPRALMMSAGVCGRGSELAASVFAGAAGTTESAEAT